MRAQSTAPHAAQASGGHTCSARQHGCRVPARRCSRRLSTGSVHLRKIWPFAPPGNAFYSRVLGEPHDYAKKDHQPQRQSATGVRQILNAIACNKLARIGSSRDIIRQTEAKTRCRLTVQGPKIWGSKIQVKLRLPWFASYCAMGVRFTGSTKVG